MIKNAQIIVSGIGLSDVYFNDDLMTIAPERLIDIKETIRNKCCFTPCEETWSCGFEENVNDTLIKSHSSYKRLTKRHYIVACRFPSLAYQSEWKSQDPLGALLKFEKQMLNLFTPEELTLHDITLRFYSYGNVTIQGKFIIRDKELSVEDYHAVSDFVHVLFKVALQDKVAKAIEKYVNAVNSITDNICLLSLPIPSELHDGNMIQNIMSQTLQFGIRTHYIYDVEKKDDFSLAPFYPILSGEWEEAMAKPIVSQNCTAYFGWSHSMYLFHHQEQEISHTPYEIPMEVVMSNWSALQGMQLRIEKARVAFMKQIEEKKKTRKNYDKISDDVKDFILKFERMIAYFDSYTISNNPTIFHMIDAQKKAFLEKDHVIRVRKKLNLLQKIVDDLAASEKKRHDDKINRILFIITIFALLNSVQITYELITNKNSQDIHTIVGIFIGLVAIVILYLRINKKPTT
ncbi:MAG: hypothetical protein PHY42_02950 [Bacilli bacterium]|nr:hypothetical protein [Bacilli bacterium]